MRPFLSFYVAPAEISSSGPCIHAVILDSRSAHISNMKKERVHGRPVSIANCPGMAGFKKGPEISMFRLGEP